jgi:MFS transporter, MHS family, proline/betaine transporter
MKPTEQRSLTREQKEAVGLLSIGTFLEYFDLMLFVHMAVLLNDLFFPKTDPFTASLLAAFAFCSTYLLRPIGALIFGYIGDNIGRKHTVIITTLMMSGSCVVMSVLPTYAEIGITASYTIIICRIIQGMSSMGDYWSTSISL